VLALLANRTVGDSAETEGPVSIPVTNIIAGDNVIAVSVHEASAASSDMYWAGEFSLTALSGPLASPQPLQILTQPRSRTNSVGSAASLYVTATGEPALFYQWRTNGVALAGQTNSTIILNPVQAGDAGNYTVIVSNRFSSLTSSVATVTVTNGGTVCTPTSYTNSLRLQTNGLTAKFSNNVTTIVLRWTNPETNSCHSNAAVILQRAMVITGPWTNIFTNINGAAAVTNSFTGKDGFYRLTVP
jgi:hypothetical protein